MRIPALVALAALALAPAPARGADASPRRGVVARVVGGGPTDAGTLARVLAAAVGGDGSAVVADPVGAARARRDAGAVEADRLAVFARVRELVREGWRAYLKADPGFAEAQLVNARRALESVLDLDGALEVLADVSLRLGAVRQNTGRAQEAVSAFALAYALDPGRELAAAEFAPAVIQAYQGVAQGAPARARLRVVAPADASVELDGASLGRGTVAVDATVGEHALVARAPGRRPLGQIVAVPAGGATVELALDPDPWTRQLDDPGLLAVGAGEERAAIAVEALATWAELDEVVVVVATWRGGQPALLGQRCATAPLACTPVLEVRYASRDKLDAAAGELWRGLPAPRPGARALPPIALGDARATEPEPPGDGGPRPPPPRRAWYENPWVWAGAGAAAALAAGAVWLIADDPAPTYEVVLPPLR